MEEKFVEVADALCPERVYAIKKDRPDYFTAEISNLIQTRDGLFKEARAETYNYKKRKLWQNAMSGN